MCCCCYCQSAGGERGDEVVVGVWYYSWPRRRGAAAAVGWDMWKCCCYSGSSSKVGRHRHLERQIAADVVVVEVHSGVAAGGRERDDFVVAADGRHHFGCCWCSDSCWCTLINKIQLFLTAMWLLCLMFV